MVIAIGLSVGCSDDEKEAARFPGVNHWDCLDTPAIGECECYGLGDGEEINVVGVPGIIQTTACEGYSSCATYIDEFLDVICTCGPAGHEPREGARDVQPVSKCPP